MISVSSIIVKTWHRWYKLLDLVLLKMLVSFLLVVAGTSLLLILEPVNSWDEEKPKISWSNRWWIYTRIIKLQRYIWVMLETMESSCIIIKFQFRHWVFFSWDIAGRLSPASLGIAKAVFAVVPLMFMAETPVGAIKSTVGSARLVVVYLNVFTTEWYILIQNNSFSYPNRARKVTTW